MKSFVDAMTTQDVSQRVASLRDLGSSFEGKDSEPFYLYIYALSLRDAADAADENDEKIALYKDAIGIADKLLADHKDGIWATIPSEATPEGQPVAPSRCRKLKEYCEAQLAWLDKHPFNVKTVVDDKVSATIELEDPDGNTHELKLQLYTAHAPRHVANFLRQSLNKVFDGTVVHGIETQEQQEQRTTLAIHLGSAMAKVAPDQPDAWLSPEDRVGFTIPKETNHLTPERGSVAFEWVAQAHGSSPAPARDLHRAPGAVVDPPHDLREDRWRR